MITLLIATTNPGKLQELQAMLRDCPLRLIGLRDLEELPEAVEDQETFSGNARVKARHYSQQTGFLTLADDSGLEVDCLNGEPGVRSARYAGPSATDEQNNALLMSRLTGIPEAQRSARFRCSAVIMRDNEVLFEAAGTLEGRIIDQPRGTNGFGYDPHFLLLESGLTSAELAPEDKNRLSHRGQAMRHIVEWLLEELPNLSR